MDPGIGQDKLVSSIITITACQSMNYGARRRADEVLVSEIELEQKVWVSVLVDPILE